MAENHITVELNHTDLSELVAVVHGHNESHDLPGHINGQPVVVRFRAEVLDDDFITARPTGTCGCGYELVWGGGEWQHDAAPYLWGNDHSPEADEPHGPARRYWDKNDDVALDPLPDVIYAYPGDSADGFPFVADAWMWQTGNQWMATANESEACWFADTDADKTPTPPRRVLPIDELPDHGTLIYRDMSGTEFKTQAHSWL